MTTEWGTILLFILADSPRQSRMVINNGEVRHYNAATRDWVTYLPEARNDIVRAVNMDGERNRQKEPIVSTLTGESLAYEGEPNA